MRLLILGVAGTFMAGVARIAAQLGHEVFGCDAAVYPPMSDVLAAQGLEVMPYEQAWSCDPQYVLVGNVCSRGQRVIEELLDRRIPYDSAPAWLFREVLQHRRVIAVAGTHGKSSTTSMVAHLLTALGHDPGFLIGAVPKNLEFSASLGCDPYFVIEADEYDTAFFDKRPKFLHYRPEILVLNNLEHDHVEIYPDLLSLQKQFQLLLRTVPPSGTVLMGTPSSALQEVIAQGVWSRVQTYGVHQEAWWHAQLAGNRIEVQRLSEGPWILEWSETGAHQVHNALAAIAAVHLATSESPERLVALMKDYSGVARRMQDLGLWQGVRVYDDFAHHPTAIALNLEALRKKVQGRLWAVLEFGSNSMRLGAHQHSLAGALESADGVFGFSKQALDWPAEQALGRNGKGLFHSAEALIEAFKNTLRPSDTLLLMSNSSLGGLKDLLFPEQI